jgi:hypothetical protein
MSDTSFPVETAAGSGVETRAARSFGAVVGAAVGVGIAAWVSEVVALPEGNAGETGSAAGSEGAVETSRRAVAHSGTGIGESAARIQNVPTRALDRASNTIAHAISDIDRYGQVRFFSRLRPTRVTDGPVLRVMTGAVEAPASMVGMAGLGAGSASNSASQS